MKVQRIVSFAIVILLFMIVIVKFTSSSVPSEADARIVFQNQLGKAFKDGIVRIIYFRKVNGQSRELMGVKFYNFEYEAEIEYPNGFNMECKSKKGEFTGWSCFMKEVHDKGEKVKRNSEITFERTEKGWKGPDNNIY